MCLNRTVNPFSVMAHWVRWTSLSKGQRAKDTKLVSVMPSPASATVVIKVNFFERVESDASVIVQTSGSGRESLRVVSEGQPPHRATTPLSVTLQWSNRRVCNDGQNSERPVTAASVRVGHELKSRYVNEGQLLAMATTSESVKLSHPFILIVAKFVH